MNPNIEMEQRPKRVVVKRERLETTSSDEDGSAEYKNPQIRDLYQKLNSLEGIMMKGHGECVAFFEKMLQQQQQMLQQQEQMLQLQQQILQQQKEVLQQHHEIPSRPAVLPISSMSGMNEFDNIDDRGYKETVNYLEYVGGLNLKEAVTLCFKETFSDCLLTSYSWLGREENNSPLCETRAVRAIHEAVLQNRHFPRPSRKEIAEQIKTALRTAKERVRSKRSGPRNPQHAIVDNFWTAEEGSS